MAHEIKEFVREQPWHQLPRRERERLFREHGHVEKRKRSYPRIGVCIALLEDAGNWLLDHPGTPVVFLLFLGVILGLLVGSQII